MAFTYTRVFDSVMGDRRVHTGTTVQASGDTGGAITTGLTDVEYFECTGMVTHSDSSGVVTVTTLDPGAAQAGFWMAIGY